jgi:hypothetical protein
MNGKCIPSLTRNRQKIKNAKYDRPPSNLTGANLASTDLLIS